MKFIFLPLESYYGKTWKKKIKIKYKILNRKLKSNTNQKLENIEIQINKLLFLELNLYKSPKLKQIIYKSIKINMIFFV